LNKANIIKGCTAIALGAMIFGFLALSLMTVTGAPNSLMPNFYDLLEHISDAEGGLMTFVGVMTIFSVIAAALLIIMGIVILIGVKEGMMKRVFFIGMLVAGAIFMLTGIVAMAEFSGTGINVGAGPILVLIIGIATLAFALVNKFVLEKKKA